MTDRLDNIVTHAASAVALLRRTADECPAGSEADGLRIAADNIETETRLALRLADSARLPKLGPDAQVY